MGRPSYKVYVTLVLFAYFKSANSVRCFDCNSSNNSMCLEPSEYDAETLQRYLPTVDCTLGLQAPGNRDFFCRKIVQTILRKGHDSEVRVNRGCGWVRHHRDCYTADNEDHLETVCQCFNDGCNAAAIPIPSGGLYTLPAAIYASIHTSISRL